MSSARWLRQEFVDAGDDGVVGAGEDGEADAVDVLLDGGGDDHLGGLAEAGVDDLHAGVAEGAGDDFGAAVVAVEAGFGDEDADWCGSGHRCEVYVAAIRIRNSYCDSTHRLRNRGAYSESSEVLMHRT